MAEFVNVMNMYELANAIRERNAIEKAKLAFEKEIFECNKQLNFSSVKSNEDMIEVMKSVMDKLDTINEAMQTFSANDVYLKKEIKKLDIAVTNLL